jgi:hypothetical protein
MKLEKSGKLIEKRGCSWSGLSLFSADEQLLFPRAAVSATDGPPRAIEAMIQAHALGAVESATICSAHAVFLASDGSFAALDAGALTGIDAPGADGLTNASLLVGAALVDGGGMVLRNCSAWRDCRSILRKANGGGKCQEPDAKQRDFHGVSP